MFRLVQMAACLAFLSGLPLSAALSPVDEFLADATRISTCKALLGKFEAPLSANDQERCLNYLKRPIEPSMLAQERVKKNDLADWMLQRPSTVNPAAELLLHVIPDEAQDLIWREYCVQKLAMAASQEGLTEDLRDACRQALEQAATETRISFAGTALLGLYRLHQAGVEPTSAETIIQLAEGVLASSDYPTANKVTALQVAGLLGSAKAVAHAREVCGSSEFSIQYRSSAIALLGKQGVAEDIQLLEKMTRSMDYRLRQSSRKAIERLKLTYNL